MLPAVYVCLCFPRHNHCSCSTVMALLCIPVSELISCTFSTIPIILCPYIYLYIVHEVIALSNTFQVSKFCSMLQCEHFVNVSCHIRFYIYYMNYMYSSMLNGTTYSCKPNSSLLYCACILGMVVPIVKAWYG